MTHTFQTRRNADAEWTTLAADPWAYGNGIAEAMQRAGLAYGEIALHLADMRDGEVLTADNGQQFRAVPADVEPTSAELIAATAKGYRVHPGQYGSDKGKWLAYGPGGWIVSRRAAWQEAAADTHAAVARSEGLGGWAVSR